MVVIKKYFCFQLLTAGMIIGWYGLAESLISSITGIVMLENVDTYFNPANFPDFDVKTARAFFINIIGTAIALNVLNVLACGLLVIGTVKRNHLLLVPWLVKNFLSLVSLSIIQLIVIVLLFTSKEIAVTFAFIVFIALAIAFYGYTWIGVFSLYDFLRGAGRNTERDRLIGNNAPSAPTYGQGHA